MQILERLAQIARELGLFDGAHLSTLPAVTWTAQIANVRDLMPPVLTFLRQRFGDSAADEMGDRLERLGESVQKFADLSAKATQTAVNPDAMKYARDDVVDDCNMLLGYVAHCHKQIKAAVADAARDMPAAKQAADDGDGAPGAEQYTVAELCKFTGLGNTALNGYAKRAGVKTPGRGKRNFRYPAANVRTILEYIIASSDDRTVVARCKAALQEIAK